MERYQNILERIRHTVIGTPTGEGLFTLLYKEVNITPKIVHLNQDIILVLHDWRTLIEMAAKKPVHVRQLVPRKPGFIGKCDAYTYGIGGV